MAAFQGRQFMTPSRQNGAATMKALLGMVLIGIAAHAGLPYLPLTGPPPMRVAVKSVAAPAPVVIEKTKAPTNLPPVLKTLALVTNTPNLETNPPVEMMAMPAGADDHPPGVPVFNLTEQSMPSITPQMLATYFRPVTIGTNGGVIGGVLPIGFVPPFTRLESHADSRAEYLLK